MSSSQKSARLGWLALTSFVAWSVVFAVAYAQSPLYTSNQNQYFLHGLARAGLGYLDHDWLANTLDPTPVFSALVFLTYALTHSGLLFYVYYALLIGTYLFSTYGIMDMLFNLRQSKARSLAFLSLFMAAHSAALRYLLSRIVSADSTFLLEGGVAGQRLLGQVFQPSTFGVLLVLSIFLFLRGRRYWAILPLAAAITVHPTYLLSGALLVLAYMGMIFHDSRNIRQPLKLGAIALAAVLPILVYAAILFGPTGAETYRQAQDILVRLRIPQHAMISVWLNWTVAVQAVIVLAALLLIRRTPLFPIYGTLILGAVALTAVQAITNSNGLALVFPWRVSTVLVPLGTSTLCAFAVTWIMDRWKALERSAGRVNAFSLTLIAGLMFIGAARFQIESSRKSSDPARPMMAYVAAHRSPGDVYVIPPRMSDFRLVSGAPIYVDFNSIPYRDTEALEWYRRLQSIYWFYGGSSDSCQTLKDMAAREGVTHVVVETKSPFTVCRTLSTPYQDASYTIYNLVAPP